MMSVAALGLAGCASITGSRAGQEGVLPNDCDVLAIGIALLVKRELPPANTYLSLTPPDNDLFGGELELVLEDELRFAGFAVSLAPKERASVFGSLADILLEPFSHRDNQPRISELMPRPPGEHPVTYRVAMVERYFVVRVDVAGVTLSEMFERNSDGQLHALPGVGRRQST